MTVTFVEEFFALIQGEQHQLSHSFMAYYYLLGMESIDVSQDAEAQPHKGKSMEKSVEG